MAKLELSDTVKDFVASEVKRLCDELVAPAGITIEQLRNVFNLHLLRQSNARLPSFATEDAVDVVCRNVNVLLTEWVDDGFGVCELDPLPHGIPVNSKLYSVRNQALRMALLERGIETDGAMNFIRFVNEEHQRIAESCVLTKKAKEALERTEHHREAIFIEVHNAKKRAREMEEAAKLAEAKWQKLEREAAYTADAFDVRMDRLRSVVAERSKSDGEN